MSSVPRPLQMAENDDSRPLCPCAGEFGSNGRAYTSEPRLTVCFRRALVTNVLPFRGAFRHDKQA